MGQSRTGSAVEAVANVVVGFGVALAAQLLIFPHFGFNPSLDQNLAIGAAFTVVSLVRSYLLRRIFNGLRRWNSPQRGPISEADLDRIRRAAGL